MEKKKIVFFLLIGLLISAAAGFAATLAATSDWKAPTLRLHDHFEVDYGQPVSIYQLIAEAKDHSAISLSMKCDGEINQEEKTVTFHTPGAYPVTIWARDSHGNAAEQTTTIQVLDRVPPSLAVQDLTVYLGDSPDYSACVRASDEIDGDLSSSVKINDSAVDWDHTGRYKITCSVADSAGNSAVASGYVLVKEQPASAISLSASRVYLAGNEYEQLQAAVTPDDWNGKITWSSSDPSVATVSGGLVVWAGEGNCVITASADDVSAECEFICSKAVASSLWLDRHTLHLRHGDSQTLSAQVWPSNWAGEVTWSSSDPAVAMVDQGEIIWVGQGVCTITAEADGQSDSCTVTCDGQSITGFLDDLFGTHTDENQNDHSHDANTVNPFR